MRVIGILFLAVGIWLYPEGKRNREANIMSWIVIILGLLMEYPLIIRPIIKYFKEVKIPKWQTMWQWKKLRRRSPERAERLIQEDRERYESEREAYNNAIVNAIVNIDSAEDEVRKMERLLRETEALKQTLYSKGVIYGKYTNFVAVATMYEYFATGRCNTFEGPNGAYNLYESEMRQNIIIGQLSTIISQLENIRSNQYALYQELERTNYNLQSVRAEMAVMKEYVKIDAMCSAITAQNSSIVRMY